MDFNSFDNLMIRKMRSIGIPSLRIAVGIVFLWFGALKVMGVSPVEDLVIQAYPVFPEPAFLIVLGFFEAIVGLGLIFKVSMRLIIFALWFQMIGVFGSIISVPSVFFESGNPFMLTFEGEFIMKNLVILAASLVVGGYEIEPEYRPDNSIEGPNSDNIQNIPS